MSTPYCTAVRLRRREVDALREAIAEAGTQLATLDRRTAELRRTVAVERRLAANFGALPDDLYFRRMRLEHDRLVGQRAAAERELERLRDDARETFAALRTLEEAAERHWSEEQRLIANAEQSAADDRAAAVFARTSA